MWLTKVLLVLTLAAIVSAKYKIIQVDTEMTFQDALDYCKSKGLYLATVKGGEKNRQLHRKLKESKSFRIWIGISRRQLDTDAKPWKWVFEGIEDLPVENFFWEKNQPDNYNNKKERCVEMRLYKSSDYVHNWNDINCDSKLSFFCESY